MTLIQSWKDSLVLFKPKNLQLFVMVTIKSIIDAYKLYIKYAWPLLAGIVALFFIAPDQILAYKSGDSSSLAHYATLLGMAEVLYGILFLVACFITRPSIFQKDCKYLRIQFIKILPYWFLMGAIKFLIFYFFRANAFKMFFVQLFYISQYFVWYVFFVLFFADSDGRVKQFFLSMWQALKMIVYNLPLIIVLMICYRLPVVVINKIWFISPFAKEVIGAFLLPIGVCIFANVYIKKLHDQFDLYFNKSQ